MDIENAKNEFIKYSEKFDLTDWNTKRKQLHSLRVMDTCKEIAEQLNLSQEEIEISELIGLLHDIAKLGKNEEIKAIEGYDHGDYGAEIVKKEIRKYIETDKYDEIIEKAIINHCKYKIQDNLSEKEEVFANILRDADKIDIFWQSLELFWKGKEDMVAKSIISEEILQEFKLEKQVEKRGKKDIEHSIDEIISIISFIFDINYKPSFRIIKEKDYINKILDRYDMKDEFTKNSVEEMREIANIYINKKMN